MRSHPTRTLGRLAAAAVAIGGVMGVAMLITEAPTGALDAPVPQCTASELHGDFLDARSRSSPGPSPAGVTSATFTLYGAIGGSLNGVPGGDGAKLTLAGSIAGKAVSDSTWEGGKPVWRRGYQWWRAGRPGAPEAVAVTDVFLVDGEGVFAGGGGGARPQRGPGSCGTPPVTGRRFRG